MTNQRRCPEELRQAFAEWPPLERFAQQEATAEKFLEFLHAFKSDEPTFARHGISLAAYVKLRFIRELRQVQERERAAGGRAELFRGNAARRR